MDYKLFGQKQQFKVTLMLDFFLQTCSFSLHKMLIDGLDGWTVDYCYVFM